MAMTTEAAAKPAGRKKSAQRSAHSSKPTATATQVGEHLSLTRQRIVGLADVEHVLVRLPDGKFDLDDCRHRYIEFLRNSRRSARSAADSKFVEAKTALLEIRTMEKLGKLVPSEMLEDTIDIITGLYRTELNTLPARFTRDIGERRRLEGLIRDLLKRIANEALKRSERVAAAEGSGRTEAFGLEAADADD